MGAEAEEPALLRGGALLGMQAWCSFRLKLLDGLKVLNGLIVGGAANGSGKRGVRGVSKTKGEVEYDGAAQSSRKRAERKFDDLRIRGILMMNYMRLIEIVE